MTAVTKRMTNRPATFGVGNDVLRQSLNELFNSSGWPAIDLMADDQNFYVQALLPGIDASNLDVQASGKNQYVTIKAWSHKNADELNFYRSEIPYGEFYRSIRLPETFNESSISSEYKNGVLTLTLPREHSSDAIKINVDTH